MNKNKNNYKNESILDINLFDIMITVVVDKIVNDIQPIIDLLPNQNKELKK